MIRIIAFGDIHMDYKCVEEIPNIAEVDLVIITGDLTNYGGVGEAQVVLKAIEELNKNILALHGNLDQPSVAEFLVEKGISIHGRGVKISDVGIFGVGGSNPTPFDTPIEYSEEELKEIVLKAYEDVKDAAVKILVSHTPPINTNADIISSGVHVGSKSIREFIEKYQPELCLTGHIHEAKSTDKIGDTLILNPGMLCARNYIEVCIEGNNISAELKNF